MTSPPTVVVVAGRRIDAVDPDAIRFPLGAAGGVKDRLRELLCAERAVAVVASAACGADVLALEAGLELGIAIRIVLPFSVAAFRTSSVVDRPGDWGPRYDSLIAAARDRGELVLLGMDADASDVAYAAVTDRLIAEAKRLGEELGANVLAVVVWDEQPRSGNDLTHGFLLRAQQAGIPTRSVSTLAP